MFGMLFSLSLMCLSLYFALAKRFRPITWFAFWWNILVAVLNLIAVLMHVYATVMA